MRPRPSRCTSSCMCLVHRDWDESGSMNLLYPATLWGPNASMKIANDPIAAGNKLSCTLPLHDPCAFDYFRSIYLFVWHRIFLGFDRLFLFALRNILKRIFFTPHVLDCRTYWPFGVYILAFLLTASLIYPFRYGQGVGGEGGMM